MPHGTCSIDGCEGPHKAHGWCHMHYRRWKRHGDPTKTVRSSQADVCQASGCDEKPLARSLCNKHLKRQRVHGSLDDPRPDADRRFWSKVDKNGPYPVAAWDGSPLSGQCWEWTGAADSLGYGSFYVGIVDGRHINTGAHRYGYETIVGSIPDGFTIDHLCRNPRCVNHEHLEPVTQAENTRRAHLGKKRGAA